MNLQPEDRETVDLRDVYTPSSTSVVFEDSDLQPRTSSSGPSVPLVIRLAMKHSGGLLKDKTQAGYAVLGLVAVAFIISALLLFGGKKDPAIIEAPRGQYIIYPNNEPPRLDRQF